MFLIKFNFKIFKKFFKTLNFLNVKNFYLKFFILNSKFQKDLEC